MSSLKLIVGLGNPGPEYAQTRHNVGANWVIDLARRFAIPLQAERKFKGEVGRGNICGVDVRLLVPATYMNLSGDAVGPLARFYRIRPAEILVAYDEMAFDPGKLRLKQGGGDNGHNGLKSVRAGLGSGDFHRLRIGVGHPGDKNKVAKYLTEYKMPVAEQQLVESALHVSDGVLSSILTCDWQSAMNHLHTDGSNNKRPQSKGGGAQ